VQEKLLDKSRAVRAGEEIDAARLFAYLREHIGALEEPPRIEQFPAGFSNLTYLLRFGERELVLRRPPVGAKIKTAHDMKREYRILSHLHPVYPKVPRALHYCEDESVVGAPFYVMERVSGVILRATPPKDFELTPDTMQRLSEAFIGNLSEIHEVDFISADLGDLGQPEGYVRRQIEGWTKRYFNARTDDVPSVERLAAWLAAHLPHDSPRPALIHNDYKYDNLVLAPEDLTRVVAVLDWEMATVGDPLMDLGTTLGYWVEQDDPAEWQRCGFGITSLAGNLGRTELVERYARQTSRDITDPVFYYAYGLLKIAVIVQQIYKRFRQGFTQDERFANLGALVRACGLMAERAIEKRRIDHLG
jgi:aminoglycoside phosphotransferase (APT) family kinase protein